MYNNVVRIRKWRDGNPAKFYCPKHNAWHPISGIISIGERSAVLAVTTPDGGYVPLPVSLDTLVAFEELD